MEQLQSPKGWHKNTLAASEREFFDYVGGLGLKLGGVLYGSAISPIDMHPPLWFWCKNDFKFVLS
jgi:hypothetical protein